MDEFAVEVTARGADGSLEPFHIYVGAPEVLDALEFESLAWCSLMDKPHKVKGASLAQAYSLAFRFVGLLVGYADLELLDRDGAPFQLPTPSDGGEGLLAPPPTIREEHLDEMAEFSIQLTAKGEGGHSA